MSDYGFPSEESGDEKQKNANKNNTVTMPIKTTTLDIEQIHFHTNTTNSSHKKRSMNTNNSPVINPWSNQQNYSDGTSKKTKHVFFF